MNNKLGQIVVLLAHPNLKESVANKELYDKVKDIEGVAVYNLYEESAELFDVEAWSRILTKASMLIFQFPFYWMSAPSMLKRWLDEVFIHVSNTPAIAGKPLQVVATTGSGADSYRSGGRKQFTADELLRPYQATAITSGMVWQTPLIVYGTASKDPAKGIAQGANQYKAIVDNQLRNENLYNVSEWKLLIK